MYGAVVNNETSYTQLNLNTLGNMKKDETWFEKLVRK